MTLPRLMARASTCAVFFHAELRKRMFPLEKLSQAAAALPPPPCAIRESPRRIASAADVRYDSWIRISGQKRQLACGEQQENSMMLRTAVIPGLLFAAGPALAQAPAS